MLRQRMLKLLGIGSRPPLQGRRFQAKNRFRRCLLEQLEDRVLLSAAVWTDQPDYLPGQVAVFNASGFQVGEAVQFQVVRTDGQPDYAPGNLPWQVTDGGPGDHDGVADGNLQTSWYVEQQYLGSALEVSATGLSSGLSATADFTDGNTPTPGITNPTSPITVNANNFTITATADDNSIIRVYRNSIAPGNLVSGVTVVETAKSGAKDDYAITVPLTQNAANNFIITAEASGKNESNGAVVPTITENSSALATTLTVSPASGTYAGTATFVATLTSSSTGLSGKSVTFTLNGVGVGSATTNSSGVATLSGVSLAGYGSGTYTAYIGASFAGDSTYQASSGTADLTVTPRAVTVTADSGQGKVYGNLDSTLTYQVTSGSLAAGDSFSGALSRAAGENVGNYAITQGSLTLGTNYTLSFVGSSFAITARAVTVTADAGQGKVYGNVDPALTYQVTSGSLASGDSFGGALSRAAGENVGNYAITQGSLTLGSNYTLSFVGSTFAITPRAVTVTADAGQGKVYGTANPALTYQVTSGSLASGDSFSGALSRAAGENVGSYAITQGTLTLGANYTLSFVGSTFAITARAVTVTADAGQGKVYGNLDPALTYQMTSGSLAAGDSFGGALSRAAGENVGGYAITQGSLSLGTNYTLSFVGSTFAITPRAVTVTANAGQGKVYGNANPALTYQVTSGNLAAGDSFSGALSRAAGENVGSYAITQGSLTLGTNYTLSFVGGTFAITPRAVTVTADAGQGKVYGNADPPLTYQVTLGSLASGDSFSGALSRAAGENVGNYAITQGSLTLGTNYTLSFVGSSFAITARAVTVTANAGQGKVYGDVDPALTYQVTSGSLASGDSFSGTLSRAAGENVGSYAITQGSLTLGSNYTLSFVGSSFAITARAVTVTADAGQGKVYGTANPALTYQVTSGSLASGDSFSGTLSRAAGENVGSYAITQGTLTLGANYTLSFVGSTFVITPRAVTVTADSGQGKVYGDVDPALTYQVTSGSLASGDSFGGALSRAAGENVGGYAITQGSLSLGANYTLSFVGSTFAITARAVTVTADFGQSKVYGNADPALTYQVTSGSLASGDSFSGTLSRAAGENVGSYAITQGTLTLGANYTLSFVGSTFAITPRAVTVTADAGQGKVYGNLDPTLTYQVTSGSLASGDSFSGTLSRAAGENVGSYAITQASLTLGTNYTLSFVGSTFAITPRTVTVTVDAGQGKVYGNADPTLTYQVTNGSLAAGDSFSGALSRAAGENVGSYAITQSSLTLGTNYTLSFVGSAFAIKARAVTVTADAGQGKVYGDADPTLTYQVTSGSVAAGDSFSGTLSRTAGENVGSYAMTQGSLTLGTNYTLSFVSGTFAITPAALAVTANHQSKVLGQPDPPLTYAVSGLKFGDTATGVLSGGLIRDAGEKVGSYAIHQGTLAANLNYKIQFTGNTLDITTGVTPPPKPAATKRTDNRLPGPPDFAQNHGPVGIGSFNSDGHAIATDFGILGFRPSAGQSFAGSYGDDSASSGDDQLAAEIRGGVFLDLNDNGTWDADEPGLAGQMVLLEMLTAEGAYAFVTSTMTNSRGAYDLTGLAPGTYRVRVLLGSDLTLTSPDEGCYTVTLARTTASAQFNFGAVRIVAGAKERTRTRLPAGVMLDATQPGSRDRHERLINAIFEEYGDSRSRDCFGLDVERRDALETNETPSGASGEDGPTGVDWESRWSDALAALVVVGIRLAGYDGNRKGKGIELTGLGLAARR